MAARFGCLHGAFFAPQSRLVFPLRILEGSMPRVAQLAAIFFACGTVLAAAAPVEKRVYKVDSVIATRHGTNLLVQVKGAVETGGWRKPRLRVLPHPEGHTLVVEFLAQPPPPAAMVIQALVPISASVHIRTRPHISSVRAEAEANEVTAQILH
jgi:hypothetical protein